MKKSGKKVISAIGVISIIAAASIGTIAYFTDSDTATNTFTVGSVNVTLDEAKVNEVGEPVEGTTRVTENTYHLLPGEEYTKDPTLHIEAGSADCYVYVTVDNQVADIEKAESDGDSYRNIAGQMENHGWKLLKNSSDETVKIDREDPLADLDVYVYVGESAVETGFVVEQTNVQTDIPVFNKFVIDGDSVINDKVGDEEAPAGKYFIEDYAGKRIVVNGYAVQADGFETALDAWNAAAFN